MSIQYGLTPAEKIERQERANAADDGISYEVYKERQLARLNHYLANKTAIDAKIARDDAELSTGDNDDESED